MIAVVALVGFYLFESPPCAPVCGHDETAWAAIQLPWCSALHHRCAPIEAGEFVIYVGARGGWNFNESKCWKDPTP